MTEIIEPTINLKTMKRADLPAIWEDFRQKIAVLKTTAETLTVADESDKAGMKLARATRLALREIRVAVEARRKELGEESLRRTQAVNADAKALKELIEPLETRLLECEAFAERAEAARAAAKLAERTAAIIAAKGEPGSYNLLTCTDEAFAGIIAALELAEKARIEAAAKAEAERLAAIAAAAAERERIRLGNMRLEEETAALRAKAIEREKLAEQEREAARAEAAKLRAEAEERMKADLAEKEAARIAAEKLRKETEAREAAAAKAAADELAKVQAEAEAARKKQAAIEAEKFRLAREAADRENARLAAERDAERKEAAEKEATLRARMLADAQARDAAEARLAAKQTADEKAAKEKAAISADFETWWNNDGSAMRPLANEDASEHVRRVSEIAWANGAFKAKGAK